MIEEKIVSLIIRNPDYTRLISEEQHGLFSENNGQFIREVKKFIAGQQPANEGELATDFKKLLGDSIPSLEIDAQLKNFLAALALRAEVDWQDDGEDEFLLCLLQLKNIALKRKLDATSQAIRQAEQQGDHEQVSRLIGEFNELTKEL